MKPIKPATMTLYKMLTIASNIAIVGLFFTLLGSMSIFILRSLNQKK